MDDSSLVDDFLKPTPRRPANPAPCRRPRRPRKAKLFPASPGCYAAKDDKGLVLYVGKAKNLRNRASHYFTKAAAEDARIREPAKLIADIDFIAADTRGHRPVSSKPRLVKSIQPYFNAHAEGRQDISLSPDPDARGLSARRDHGGLLRRKGGQALRLFHLLPRACRLLCKSSQQIFKFRTCALDIDLPMTNGCCWFPGSASWPASASAPHRATCESPRRSTASRSAACGSFSRGRRSDSSAR